MLLVFFCDLLALQVQNHPQTVQKSQWEAAASLWKSRTQARAGREIYCKELRLGQGGSVPPPRAVHGLCVLHSPSHGTIQCHQIPLSRLHLPSVSQQRAQGGPGSAFSLLQELFPFTNLWISPQASCRCWEGRIQRRNKPGREGAGGYLSPGREGKAEQPSWEPRVALGRR